MVDTARLMNQANALMDRQGITPALMRAARAATVLSRVTEFLQSSAWFDRDPKYESFLSHVSALQRALETCVKDRADAGLEVIAASGSAEADLRELVEASGPAAVARAFEVPLKQVEVATAELLKSVAEVGEARQQAQDCENNLRVAVDWARNQLSDLGERVRSERKSAESAVDSVSKKLETLAQQVTALSDEVNEMEGQFRQETKQTSEALRTELLNKLEDEALDTRGQFKELGSSLREEFREERRRIASETQKLSEQSDAAKTTVRGSAQEAKDAIEKEKQLITHEAEKLRSELQERGKEYKRLTQLATGQQLSDAYASDARKEWWTGLIAYGVGFTILALIAILLWLQIDRLQPGEDVSWQYSALKLGLGSAAAAASAVAIRVGNRSWDRAASSRQTEMELRAIGPFLLDVGDRRRVDDAKLAFVDRRFSGSCPPSGQTPDRDEA